jgi:hypothetical protein
MEKLIYETKPFILLGFAVYAINNHMPSTLLIVSSAILAGTALTVLGARFYHRKLSR